MGLVRACWDSLGLSPLCLFSAGLPHVQGRNKGGCCTPVVLGSLRAAACTAVHGESLDALQLRGLVGEEGLCRMKAERGFP